MLHRYFDAAPFILMRLFISIIFSAAKML